MAKKDENATGQETLEGTVSIDNLQNKLGIKDCVYNALKVYYDWADGLMMTEDEFKTAHDKWLNHPVNGRG